MKYKGDIAVNKVAAWIIGILVFGLVLTLILQIDVGMYLKNILPDFSVPKEDIIISSIDNSLTVDSKSENKVCSGSPSGAIKQQPDKNYYIFLDNKNTNLIWDGNEKTGQILLADKETPVAEINNGVILVNQKYFDYDSDDFQSIRFISGSNLNVFAKIHNSYYYGNNQLCIPKKGLNINYGWWNEQKVFELKITEKGETDFSPDIVIPKDSNFKKLYLVKEKNYIQVNALEINSALIKISNWLGDTLSPDRKDLMRIYPDGSVWIQNVIKRGELIQNIELRNRKSKEFFYETNLRISNYEEIYKMLKE